MITLEKKGSFDLMGKKLSLLVTTLPSLLVADLVEEEMGRH